MVHDTAHQHLLSSVSYADPVQDLGANANISLEWQGTQSVTDAIDPAKIFQHQLLCVNSLHLDTQMCA